MILKCSFALLLSLRPEYQNVAKNLFSCTLVDVFIDVVLIFNHYFKSLFEKLAMRLPFSRVKGPFKGRLNGLKSSEHPRKSDVAQAQVKQLH
jgi:hypothetical protein